MIRILLALLVCLSLPAQMTVLRRRVAASGGAFAPATFRGFDVFNGSAANTGIQTYTGVNVTAGDLIKVTVAGSTNFTVSAATCGSDTLTLAKSAYVAGSDYKVAVYYKQNATAGTAVTCSITFSANVEYRAIDQEVYGGVATSGGPSQSSCNSASCDSLAATSTSRTAQNVTSTSANSLLIATGVDWNGAAHTAANGYNLRADDVTQFTLDKSVSSTGSYPGGNFSTVGSTDQYISIFLVFPLL